MGNEYEHIWERMLPEAHHQAFYKLYRLSGFLNAASGRCERYFAAVAASRATLGSVLQREPSDQDLLSFIALVLGKDRTFLPYVSKNGGASQAHDPERWRLVLEAGAGAILGEYLISLENPGGN